MENGFSGKIASLFINSKLTLLLMVGLMIIGVYSSTLIPREEEPQIKFNGPETVIEETPQIVEEEPVIDEIIEERKNARLKMIEDKKIAAEEKKAEADAKRKQLLEDKNNKKTDFLAF